MRTLVLYYSQTGKTKLVAELLARRLNADLMRFTCPAFERGFVGGIRQAWAIFTRSTPEISLPHEAEGPYEMVVLAGPVWAARPAPPLRSALTHRPSLGARQALFLTCDGTSTRFRATDALAEAKSLGAHPPAATALFTAADIAGPELSSLVETFADRVRAAMDAHRDVGEGARSDRSAQNPHLASA